MAESLSRINNYVTKDSLKVPEGEPKSINLTKNIWLNEIEIEEAEEIKDDNLEINRIANSLEYVKSDTDEFSEVSEEDLKLIENKFNGYVIVSQHDGYIILNAISNNADSYENYISFGKIKKFLGIKDGVLRKENDLEAMNIEGWGNLDNMQLKTNSNLKIPIEEINFEKLGKNKKISTKKTLPTEVITPNKVLLKKPINLEFFSKIRYPGFLNKNQHFIDFIKSLEHNKELLKKDLNLSEEEYIELAQVSLVIIEAETKSGLDKKFSAKVRSCLKRFNVFAKYEAPSLGISNLKMSNFDNSPYKKLLPKYGISYDKKTGLSPDIENNDKKAAIATIIRLKEIKDDYYNKYLKNIASKYTEEEQDRIVNLSEYFFVRWKGQYLNEKEDIKTPKKTQATPKLPLDYKYKHKEQSEKLSKKQKSAKENIDAIIEYRKNPNKYVNSDSSMYMKQIYDYYIQNKDYKELQKQQIKENQTEQLLNHDFHL